MEQFLDEETEDGSEDETLPGRRPISLSFTRALNTRAAVSWVMKHHGKAGIEKLVAELPADVVDELGGEILRPPATAWVPFQSHALLLNKIDEIFGTGDTKLLIEVGKHMAFHDLPGIARPLALLMSPGWLVEQGLRIWKAYNSHGHWEVTRGERDARAILLNAPEADYGFCVGAAGWVEGAFLFVGAKEVRVVIDHCVTRGDPYCSLAVTWLEKTDTARTKIPRAPR